PLTARSHGLRRGLLAFALTGWRSFLAYWLRSDRCEFLRNPESHHFYVAHPIAIYEAPTAEWRTLQRAAVGFSPRSGGHQRIASLERAWWRRSRAAARILRAAFHAWTSTPKKSARSTALRSCPISRRF